MRMFIGSIDSLHIKTKDVIFVHTNDININKSTNYVSLKNRTNSELVIVFTGRKMELVQNRPS